VIRIPRTGMESTPREISLEGTSALRRKALGPLNIISKNRLAKVTSESSFEVQRLCTDLNAVNAKMKKKLSVPGA
jgi:hypothetical protein